jgi:hypothetical protein
MTMRSSGVYLSLYRLDSLQDWEKRMANVVSRHGYVVTHGGKVWPCDERHRLSSRLEYSDGFQVSTVRLGPRFHGLTINPHVYFFENSSDVPSAKPSRELLDEPVSLVLDTLARRIEKVQELHSHLAEAGCGVHSSPVDLQQTRSDLLDNVRLVTGSQNAEHHVGEPLGRILQKDGFQRTPTSFEVFLSAPSGDDTRVTLYSRHLANAFARVHARCEVRVVSWIDIMRMVEPSKDTTTHHAASRVLLVGVHGKKGEPLMAAEVSALKRLDENGVPYRMFSLENRAMSWSAFDQLSILAEAAGGRAYSVQLPFEHTHSPVVFVGLDLGHPLDSGVTWAVATIVDSTGHLIGFWRKHQERDETLREKTLTAALNWVYLVLRKMYRGQCKVMVLRDGRLFENENPDLYTQFFGEQHTLVEVVKHPVPLMLVGKNCAPAGTMCIPKGSIFFFVLTSRSKNRSEVNLPLKIRVVHDGLEMGQHRVGQIIAGLSFAPTLGLNPTRSPVPIYWANGFASMSETNHQFSGVHWVAHT